MLQKIFAVVFLIIALNFNVKGQDFSNKGKDFWLCYPGHIDAGGSVMGIYITSDTNATGTIYVGTVALPFALGANQVVRKFVGPNGGGDAPNSTIHLSSQPDGITVNAGIRVVASANVVVFAHIIRSARSGATLVLPTKVWGKEYLVANHRSTGAASSGQGFGEICVMAKDSNTTVEITPSVASRNGARAAGVPFQITLPNPGDIYQLQFQQQADISGTVVKSISNAQGGCKPIAVFSATTWTALDCNNASGGDNLLQQLFPKAAWGKQFLTAPMKKVYNAGGDNNFDIIKVYVDDPLTVVTKLENGITSTLTGLNAAGKFYQFATSQPTLIQADKPIQVTQIVTSQQCGSPQTLSDPEMVVLNAVEQTINKITVFAAHQSFVPAGQSNVTAHFLNVITKNTNVASFRVNGALPSTAFTPIPGTVYSYNKIDITTQAATNPVFTLKADSGFSAIAFGFGSFESYGYNAGTNVVDLFQFATVSNQLADTSITFAAACKNSPFEFFQRLPYKPLSITWDFSTSGLPNPPFANYVNNNPSSILVDSTFVQDRWVYRYKNPNTYTATVTGSFPITVIVNNPTSDGCSGLQEIDYNLEVFDPPVADFNWMHTGCATDTVFLREVSNNTGGRNVFKWRWLYHDNTTDSVKAPKKLYNIGGSFDIKLQIVTDVGCVSDTISKTIIMTAPPVCSLSLLGGGNTGCAGVPITVVPNCSIAGGGAGGTLVKWVYNWGDGSPNDTLNAGSNAVHTYTTPGNFVITLQSISSTGCKSAITPLNITIHGALTVDFTMPANICLPYAVANFNNTSNSGSPLGTYSWNFGDGSPVENTVNGSHLYTAVGPFTVTLNNISPFGCAAQIQKVFNNVRPRPTSPFNSAAEICIKDSLSFTSNANGNGGSITNYNWDFGDNTTSNIANPKKKWNTPGAKTIKHWIITDQGCVSDTTTTTIFVNESPVNDFTFPNTGRCANTPITFTPTSSSNNGVIITWNWSWGDGSPVQIANNNAPITHSFAAEGNYIIKLWTVTDKGCVADTTIKTLVITARPLASFNLPAGVCLPLGTAAFTNTTTISDGTINTVTYSWNFGDGSASVTLSNPTHNFTGVGPFNITLTATSAIGCVDDSIRQLVNIYARPSASIAGNTEVCLNDNIVLTSTANPISGTIAEHYWDNGSGSFLLGAATLTTSFATIGNKTIKHYIKTSNGCISDTASYIIIVNPLPTANFSMSNTKCERETITFTSNALPNVGTLTEWTWNWGDGSTPQIVNSAAPITHTYAVAGVYTVTLTVKTDKGCVSGAFPQSIVVNPKPVANFNLPANVCLPIGSATFSNTTTISNGTINTVIYSWNFGDGSLNATTFNGVHNYSAIGPFNVQLTATSLAGCKHDSIKVFNNIRLRPTAGITASNEVCVNGNITFTSVSTGNGGTIIEHYWDNGNGVFALGTATLTTSFATNGNKTIRHFIKTDQGCLSDTATKTIFVNSLPVLNFTVSNPRCEDKQVTFTSTSTTVNGVINSYSWNYGDGSAVVNTNSNTPLTHVFDTTGNFTVSLTATTDKGCTNTAFTQVVSIHPNPIVRMYLPEICLNDPIAQFLDSSKIADNTEAAFTYLWNFGDPNATGANPNTSGVKNPTHQYIQAVNYNMWLEVTSGNGCKTRKDTIFTVNGATPAANFNVLNAANLCSNKDVVIENTSTVNFGVVTQLEIYWDWTNNPTLKTVDPNPTPNKQYNYAYPQFGTPPTRTYTVRLVAYSGALTGPCNNAIIKTITVLGSPNVNFAAVPEICQEAVPATLNQAQETTGIPGTGVFSGPGIAGALFNPAAAGIGTHTIRYTYTATNGCNTFKEQTVAVNATPDANAGPASITILSGGNGLLPASSSTTNATYLWSPATWLSATNILQPSSSATDDITYTLTVTSDKGCKASDNILVKVLKGPRVYNAFSPNGDGINDRWTIDYLDTYPGCIIEVFNIYGQIVFRSVGYSQPWDGTFKGKPLPIGTYYYVIDPKNGRSPITGYVGIVK